MSLDDDRVAALHDSIERGDVSALRALLESNPGLATARIGDDDTSGTALHAVTDHPGHRPACSQVIAVLVGAGADPDGRFAGPHRETPLHWAASSDDVEAVDALLDAGADIEADGGVLTGGPPLDDAVVFAQWGAARRLVERGATTGLFHAAALGLDERVGELLVDPPPRDQVTAALWHAARAGRTGAVRRLLDAGGDPRWVGWDGQTPIDVAGAEGHSAVGSLLDPR